MLHVNVKYFLCPDMYMYPSFLNVPEWNMAREDKKGLISTITYLQP